MRSGKTVIPAAALPQNPDDYTYASIFKQYYKDVNHP